MLSPEPQFVIVGGAEKSGTTALFSYLAAHPQVCPSVRKETDYFRTDVAGLDDYLQLFDARRRSAPVFVESSPGYLAEAATVAPRMSVLLPHARHIFILRDPIDRLRSSFRFYKSRLHVPEAMTFEEFVTACFEHEEGISGSGRHAIGRWHLSALRRGCYEEQLPHFQNHIVRTNILILDYAWMRNDMPGAMKLVAGFAGIDPGFYSEFHFTRENVSFLAKRRSIHRFAISINDRFEQFWRRHPWVKRSLLTLYKRVNEHPVEQDVLSEQLEYRLREWYRETYALLSSIGNPQLGKPDLRRC